MGTRFSYTITRLNHFSDYVVLSVARKPGDNGMSFQPGQYASVSFRRNHRWSPERCLSITSDARDPRSLEFAFTISGQFTRCLSELNVGDQLRVRGPFGHFTLPRSLEKIPNPTVLLAAGIGITPYMSMLRSLLSDSNRQLVLIYAHRSSPSIPFEKELRLMEANHPNFRVVFALTGTSSGKSEKSSSAGRIDDRLLNHLLGTRLLAYNFYVCGPPSFIDSMSKILGAKNLDPDKMITESFTQSKAVSRRLKPHSIAGLTYSLSAATLLIGIVGITALDLIHYLPTATSASQASAVRFSSVVTPPSGNGAAEVGNTTAKTLGAASSTAPAATTAASSTSAAATTSTPVTTAKTKQAYSQPTTQTTQQASSSVS